MDAKAARGEDENEAAAPTQSRPRGPFEVAHGDIRLALVEARKLSDFLGALNSRGIQTELCSLPNSNDEAAQVLAKAKHLDAVGKMLLEAHRRIKQNVTKERCVANELFQLRKKWLICRNSSGALVAVLRRTGLGGEQEVALHRTAHDTLHAKLPSSLQLNWLQIDAMGEDRLAKPAIDSVEEARRRSEAASSGVVQKLRLASSSMLAASMFRELTREAVQSPPTVAVNFEPGVVRSPWWILTHATAAWPKASPSQPADAEPAEGDVTAMEVETSADASEVPPSTEAVPLWRTLMYPILAQVVVTGERCTRMKQHTRAWQLKQRSIVKHTPMRTALTLGQHMHIADKLHTIFEQLAHDPLWRDACRLSLLTLPIDTMASSRRQLQIHPATSPPVTVFCTTTGTWMELRTCPAVISSGQVTTLRANNIDTIYQHIIVLLARTCLGDLASVAQAAGYSTSIATQALFRGCSLDLAIRPKPGGVLSGSWDVTLAITKGSTAHLSLKQGGFPIPDVEWEQLPGRGVTAKFSELLRRSRQQQE